MGKIFACLKCAVGTLARLGAVGAQIVLIAAALIIFYDVVMRYVFNQPTTWVLEVSEYMLVFIAVAGTAQIQKQKAHIRMDYFFYRFSSGLRRRLNFFFNIFLTGFSFLIFFTSAQMTITAYKYGSKSSSLLGTPLFIPYAIVPLGILILFLQSIVDTFESFKEISGSGSDEGRKSG